MKIQQFIKSLNNTEIGRGNTNECYVRVPKACHKIHNIFDSSNLQPTFYDKKNGSKIESIHITIGSEFRINGLGDYYRDQNAHAGDEIVFERIDENGITNFFLDIHNAIDSITFQKNSKGFEVLNPDRLPELSLIPQLLNNTKYSNVIGELKVEFKESDFKRSDSPEKTDFYNLLFNDSNLLDQFKNKECLNLSYSQTQSQPTLKKTVIWQFYEFTIKK